MRQYGSFALLGALVVAIGCGGQDAAVAPTEPFAMDGMDAASRPPTDPMADAGPTALNDAAVDASAEAGPPTGIAATVFTYNICGADSNCKVADPTAAVLANVTKYKPAAFMLQEVCSGQADTISSALSSMNVPYVQRFQNAATFGANIGCGGLEGWGNAVFHIGTKLGPVEEQTFASQGPISRPQNRGYVCVQVPAPNFWACSTHIDVAAAQQKAQIDEMKAVAAKLTTQGGIAVPVIVGGDFNVGPASASIDGMFSAAYAQGKGSLLEKDVALDRTTVAGGATEGGSKIDYLFHTSNIQVTASSVIVATSDHRLLLGSVLLPP